MALRGWPEADQRSTEETAMATRVAINDFGRIGRPVLRSAVERDADIELVAVNDVADPATLAQRLKLDSVYRRFERPVAADGDWR
jgi:glyceraldehyde 3-phosphate dehydrogenase